MSQPLLATIGGGSGSARAPPGFTILPGAPPQQQQQHQASHQHFASSTAAGDSEFVLSPTSSHPASLLPSPIGSPTPYTSFTHAQTQPHLLQQHQHQQQHQQQQQQAQPNWNIESTAASSAVASSGTFSSSTLGSNNAWLPQSQLRPQEDIAFLRTTSDVSDWLRRQAPSHSNPIASDSNWRPSAYDAFNQSAPSLQPQSQSSLHSHHLHADVNQRPSPVSSSRSSLTTARSDPNIDELGAYEHLFVDSSVTPPTQSNATTPAAAFDPASSNYQDLPRHFSSANAFPMQRSVSAALPTSNSTNVSSSFRVGLHQHGLIVDDHALNANSSDYLFPPSSQTQQQQQRRATDTYIPQSQPQMQQRIALDWGDASAALTASSLMQSQQQQQQQRGGGGGGGGGHEWPTESHTSSATSISHHQQLNMPGGSPTSSNFNIHAVPFSPSTASIAFPSGGNSAAAHAARQRPIIEWDAVADESESDDSDIGDEYDELDGPHYLNSMAALNNPKLAHLQSHAHHASPGFSVRRLAENFLSGVDTESDVDRLADKRDDLYPTHTTMSDGNVRVKNANGSLSEYNEVNNYHTNVNNSNTSNHSQQSQQHSITNGAPYSQSQLQSHQQQQHHQQHSNFNPQQHSQHQQAQQHSQHQQQSHLQQQQQQRPAMRYEKRNPTTPNGMIPHHITSIMIPQLSSSPTSSRSRTGGGLRSSPIPSMSPISNPYSVFRTSPALDPSGYEYNPTREERMILLDDIRYEEGMLPSDAPPAATSPQAEYERLPAPQTSSLLIPLAPAANASGPVIFSSSSLTLAPEIRLPDSLAYNLLHNEIISFTHSMHSLQSSSLHLREELACRTRWAIRSVWPKAVVSVVGSVCAGVALPKSDLDFVVYFDKSREEIEAEIARKSPSPPTSPTEPSSPSSPSSITNPPFAHAGSLIKLIGGRKKSKLLFRSTKIQVFKDINLIRLRDGCSGISMDLWFPIAADIHKRSQQHTALIHGYMSSYPAFYPLSCTIKTFMQQNLLNSGYSGLGSYGILLMIVRFLQYHRLESRTKGVREEGNLGRLLCEFFRFYISFDYENLGLDVREEGRFFDKSQLNEIIRAQQLSELETLRSEAEKRGTQAASVIMSKTATAAMNAATMNAAVGKGSPPQAHSRKTRGDDEDGSDNEGGAPGGGMSLADLDDPALLSHFTLVIQDPQDASNSIICHHKALRNMIHAFVKAVGIIDPHGEKPTIPAQAIWTTSSEQAAAQTTSGDDTGKDDGSPNHHHDGSPVVPHISLPLSRSTSAISAAGTSALSPHTSSPPSGPVSRFHTLIDVAAGEQGPSQKLCPSNTCKRLGPDGGPTQCPTQNKVCYTCGYMFVKPGVSTKSHPSTPGGGSRGYDNRERKHHGNMNTIATPMHLTAPGASLAAAMAQQLRFQPKGGSGGTNPNYSNHHPPMMNFVNIQQRHIIQGSGGPTTPGGTSSLTHITPSSMQGRQQHKRSQSRHSRDELGGTMFMAPSASPPPAYTGSANNSTSPPQTYPRSSQPLLSLPLQISLPNPSTPSGASTPITPGAGPNGQNHRLGGNHKNNNNRRNNNSNNYSSNGRSNGGGGSMTPGPASYNNSSSHTTVSRSGGYPMLGAPPPSHSRSYSASHNNPTPTYSIGVGGGSGGYPNVRDNSQKSSILGSPYAASNNPSTALASYPQPYSAGGSNSTHPMQPSSSSSNAPLLHQPSTYSRSTHGSGNSSGSNSGYVSGSGSGGYPARSQLHQYQQNTAPSTPLYPPQQQQQHR